jgi:hypothetical protein
MADAIVGALAKDSMPKIIRKSFEYIFFAKNTNPKKKYKKIPIKKTNKSEDRFLFSFSDTQEYSHSIH